MVWTQADLDKLHNAIVALLCGEMVQSVEYDGPPKRSTTYQAANIEQMQATYARESANLAISAGTRSSYKLVATKKGL